MRQKKHLEISFLLVLYDLLIFVLADVLLFVLSRKEPGWATGSAQLQSILAVAFLLGFRLLGKIYRQIWRYGGIQCYIRLLLVDVLSFLIFFLAELLLIREPISFVKLLAFWCVNTLVSLSIRLIYRYAYKYGAQNTHLGCFLRLALKIASLGRVQTETDLDRQKIRVAVIGAGSIGVGLVEELLDSHHSHYIPVCFVDSSSDKVGRTMHGMNVLSENEASLDVLRKHEVREVIFAVPNMKSSRKRELYDYYQKAGFQVKVFDFSPMDPTGRKRQLRDIKIEDLLMRKQKEIIRPETVAYYRGKVILITGGGGSIGSELCRQLAKMEPKQIVVLDIYENCAYELQQSIRFAYQGAVDVRVEIASICDRRALDRCFQKYHPEICINAAAHKHVPLMENNCVEAVENNVFGCLNVIEACRAHGCKRFLMVSTDKAVNPTNVMGATKRVCEMIMQAYSTEGELICSATRFGNVLGSAGSVIPLFQRQIAAGGPVTVTDRRIIRYFMSIPEASQLVLTSGAMAENGELFVLDMGKPVRIYDLAQNMIRLSGQPDIEIVETGLRPGEKLHEELLVKSEGLEKTENDMIFIEHEEPVSMEMLTEKLKVLRTACDEGIEDGVRDALREVVPTFRKPEEVNGEFLNQKNDSSCEN